MFTFLLVVFIIDVILLIVVVLMQSGSGADAGLFGGSLTQGAFGAKSSEALVKITGWLVAIFMIFAFLMGFLQVQKTKGLIGSDEANVSSTGEVTTTTLAEDVLPLGVEEAGEVTTTTVAETAPLDFGLGAEGDTTFPSF